MTAPAVKRPCVTPPAHGRTGAGLATPTGTQPGSGLRSGQARTYVQPPLVGVVRDGFRHGTTTGFFAHRCRCELCGPVGARWNKQYAVDVARNGPRLVAVVGSVRRVQALACIGWAATDLAPHLGLKKSLPFMYGRPRMRRDTAAALAGLYVLLSDTPGPSRWARTHAARLGWAPPICWDDDTIDDPAADPAPAITSGQRDARAEDDTWLRAQGCTDEEIARRFNIDVESLHTWRRRAQVAS